MVKRIEDFGCRLMDGEQYRRARIGYLFQGLDKLYGAERIQSRCWLCMRKERKKKVK